MEKVAAIREARVTENQTLSAVAGEATHARALAATISRANEATKEVNISADKLAQLPADTSEQLVSRLLGHADLFRASIQAAANLEDAQQYHLRVQREFELGLSRTFAEQLRAAEQVDAAAQDAAAAAESLDTALAPLRSAMAAELGDNAELVDTLVAHARATSAERLWNERLATDFTLAELGGRAAATLSRAFAQRWKIEMGAASELARARNERAAYHAAPRVYRARRVMDVITAGIMDARKFFLAFNPGERLVRVRFVAEDEPQTDIFELSPEQIKQ